MDVTAKTELQRRRRRRTYISKARICKAWRDEHGDSEFPMFQWMEPCRVAVSSQNQYDRLYKRRALLVVLHEGELKQVKATGWSNKCVTFHEVKPLGVDMGADAWT